MTDPAELAKAFIEAADPHKDAFVSDLNDLSSVTLDGDFNLQAGIAAMLDQLASTMSAEEVRERAAEIAEHLNGWGVPPAPKLADHIAKVIRAMPLTK